MGLFDFVSKMIKGEPVFDARPPATEASQQSVDDTRTETGHKVTPEVRVTRVKSTRNGDKKLTYAWFQNHSTYSVVLKKFYVMGRSVSMQVRLGPGEGREVQVYSGGVADNEHDAHAYVDIMIEQNGDYFQQEFHVEFDRQADGTYLIEEFHPESHVRDT